MHLNNFNADITEGKAFQETFQFQEYAEGKFGILGLISRLAQNFILTVNLLFRSIL